MIQGATIGVGKRFSLMAKSAAARFTYLTGLPARVLGLREQRRFKTICPHHLKFELFEIFPKATTIVFFDADMVFLKPFDPDFIMRNTHGFAAVRDLSTQPWIIADAARAGVKPENYFNSGFFIIRRYARPILWTAKSLIGQIETPFKDQTFLNRAVALWKNDPAFLPKQYNFHVDRGHGDLDGIIGAHIHWIAKEPPRRIERYYLDAASMFWRDDL